MVSRGIYEKLRAALSLPGGHDQGSPFFQSGDVHILPSFFNLLIHLQNQVAIAGLSSMSMEKLVCHLPFISFNL